jgi:RNA polymerase sigma-32 factor
MKQSNSTSKKKPVKRIRKQQKPDNSTTVEVAPSRKAARMAERAKDRGLTAADLPKDDEDIVEIGLDTLEVLGKESSNSYSPRNKSHSTTKTSSATLLIDNRSPSESRDVVPYSALNAYLREMRRYPQLSREEEHELAVQYKELGDIEAAYKLVSSNLWLVVKIARDYERAARSLLDLIQEGNIGLMEAVKNFDPHRGVRFPSYAVWWIKAYIIRYVIANWRMVKIGTTQAQRKLFFNLQKERDKLEREGFYPGPKLLAERLDVRESDIVEMQQRLGSPDVSVDAPLGDESSDLSLLSVIPSKAISAEDALVKKEMSQLISEGFEKFTKTLNTKENAIFEQRLMNESKATLHDLSEELGISKERVRQIEVRVKEKLKAFLLEHYGQAIEQLDF